MTHRKGRGWRGGFFGSLVTTWLLLELQKFLKISKHLELLPRPLGQDWSGIWLQNFEGNITIWPKTVASDFLYILSDPSPERLARMLLRGQQATFPKLLFIKNRMKIERQIQEGLGKADVGTIGGQAPASEEGSNDDDIPLQKVDRRSSVIEEIRRQSGVFFDDSEIDGDETGASEEDIAISEDEHGKTS